VPVQASGIDHPDASGVEMIANLVQRFRANGVILAFSGVKAPVREVMDRTGLADIIGGGRLFATDRDALRGGRSGLGTS
jgi:SulP family sulfate permease